MYQKKIIFCFLISLVFSAFAHYHVQAQSSQNYKNASQTLDKGGGGVVKSSSFQMWFSLGQTASGNLSGVSFKLSPAGFIQPPGPFDSLPPAIAISPDPPDAGCAGVSIVFTTSELSTAEVKLGTSTSYGTTGQDLTFSTTHTISFSGLLSSTPYHYSVTAADASGNKGESGDKTFTTKASTECGSPPVISNPSVSATDTTATFTWKTDKAANSQVCLKTSTVSEFCSTLDKALVTEHSVAVSGLSGGITYTYSLKSSDVNGTSATSFQSTFTTTSDTAPPNITNILLKNVTDRSATVTWETDEDATSQVEYGTSASYGSKEPSADPDPSSVTLTKAHQITLTGLSANGTYFFKVKSKDKAGNAAEKAGDSSFTTSTECTKSPVISGVSAENITSSSAAVIWQTDEPATAKVEYSTDTSYGNSKEGSSNATSHTVPLTGLSVGTTYNYRVRSVGICGTTLEATSTGKFSTKSSSEVTTATQQIEITEAMEKATVKDGYQWMMLSLYVNQQGVPPSVLFKDSKIYRYNPNSASTSSQYYEPGEIRFGEGFWVGIKNFPLQASASGEKKVEKEDETQSTIVSDISSGWNMVGNPYDFDVAINDFVITPSSGGGSCSKAASDVFTIQGKNYAPANGVLKPNTGYWLKLEGSGCKGGSLKIPAKKAKTRMAKEFFMSGENSQWSLKISAQVKGEKDLYNYIGIAREASNGYDGMDLQEPPSFGEGITLSFPHDDFKYRGNYLTDFRTEKGAHEWNVELSSSLLNEQGVLLWESSSSLPEGNELLLLDVEENKTVDMTNTTSHSFNTLSGLRHFKIILREQGKESEKIGLPILSDALVLPNPVRQKGELLFSLNRDAFITIEIYTMTGKLIGFLKTGEFQFAKKKARVKLLEDMGGDGGAFPYPNGVYLLKIKAKAFTGEEKTLIRKMVIVR